MRACPWPWMFYRAMSEREAICEALINSIVHRMKEGDGALRECQWKNGFACRVCQGCPGCFLDMDIELAFLHKKQRVVEGLFWLDAKTPPNLFSFTFLSFSAHLKPNCLDPYCLNVWMFVCGRCWITIQVFFIKSMQPSRYYWNVLQNDIPVLCKHHKNLLRLFKGIV